MYKPPIEIVEDMQNKFSKQFDEWIVRAVISCGFNVDKERLFHALSYDKYAYESGYSDGKLDAMKELVRCKDCKWFAEGKWCRNPNNDMVQGGTTGEWFCGDGKRKDGADDE